VHAGRITGLGISDGMATVAFRQRANGAYTTVFATRVIDCTGPGTDVTQSTDPLMQALLRAEMARPDPLRLGLDVSETGALLSRSGLPSRRLFAVGPLTKGAFWEITSVSDIRAQCHEMARDLGKRLAAMGGGNGHARQPAGWRTGETAPRKPTDGESRLGIRIEFGVDNLS
jgi:uncharacterized NAD(P)/FAD-binding protein YdhS